MPNLSRTDTNKQNIPEEPIMAEAFKLLNCTHKAEWTPIQAHYFSENLVAPGIEPAPLDL
jgi:hypothetical protein